MSRLLHPLAGALLALALLGPGAIRANAAVGPVITVQSYTPNPIPAAGGTVTVTATVTDSTAALTGVTLDETYDNSTQVKRTAPMTVGGDGVTYTASIPVDLNPNNGQNGESLIVSATDSASNSTSKPVATQLYSNTPPSIPAANVSFSPNPIPTAGAMVTVTAQVTDPALGLSSVVLYETYDNSTQVKRTAPMTVGGDGVTYTASIPVDLNPNNGQSGESLYIVATDPAGNSTYRSVAAQLYSNVAPTVTVKSISPNPIPAAGAMVTVTAQVTDPALGLSSVVLYETYDNSTQVKRTAPMTVGGDGVTYTASIPVDLNSNSGQNGESLYIVATDPANNSTSRPVGTQGYTNPPPSGSLPILATSDPTKPVLNPPVVAAGGPDLPLTIAGNGFTGVTALLFNGVTLAPASVTQTQINVTVPAALVVNPGSYAVTIVAPAPGGFSNGVNLIVAAAAPPVPLYALSYQNSTFLLTDDASQYASLTANGWVGGVTGHAYANATDEPGLTPLYRLLEPSTGDHFYTTDPGQRASLIASGSWQDRGICCYVYATSVSGSVPLFKALNTATSQHLFTGSAAQYNALPVPPWSLRGPAAYILP